MADGAGRAEAGFGRAEAGTDKWADGVAAVVEAHPAAISTTAGTTIAPQARTLESSHPPDTGPRSSGIRDKLATMTRPTARVLALLEILQTGGTHTVASLAARLEVDERTVRRYAGHLIDLEGGRKALVTVHPSYLLRLPDADAKAQEYARFVEDLRIAADLLRKSARAA